MLFINTVSVPAVDCKVSPPMPHMSVPAGLPFCLPGALGELAVIDNLLKTKSNCLVRYGMSPLAQCSDTIAVCTSVVSFFLQSFTREALSDIDV